MNLYPDNLDFIFSLNRNLKPYIYTYILSAYYGNLKYLQECMLEDEDKSPLILTAAIANNQKEVINFLLYHKFPRDDTIYYFVENVYFLENKEEYINKWLESIC